MFVDLFMWIGILAVAAVVGVIYLYNKNSKFKQKARVVRDTAIDQFDDGKTFGA